MAAYDNVFQRPTSLFFASNKYGNAGAGSVASNNGPVVVNTTSVNSVGSNNGAATSNISGPASGALMLAGSVAGVAALNINDVFGDEQEDQIVPDCSVAPKLDLSPVNEPWVGGGGAGGVGGVGGPVLATGDSNCSHGFLSTAVHLSLQEVSRYDELFNIFNPYVLIVKWLNVGKVYLKHNTPSTHTHHKTQLPSMNIVFEILKLCV